MPELDVFNLPVFQDADIFPMIPADELAELPTQNPIFIDAIFNKKGIDGVSRKKDNLIVIDPSEKYEGYLDVTVFFNDYNQSLKKPILPKGLKIIPWITDWDGYEFSSRKPISGIRREHDEKRKQTKNCIYFIYAEEINRVKIGYTGDEGASYRVESIKTSSPVALRLIGTIQGNMKKEREFHRRFDQQRKHREWFEVSGELLSFMNETFGQWR